jgi:hypothetical protein
MKFIKLSIAFPTLFVIIPVAIACNIVRLAAEALCDFCDSVLKMVQTILEA